MGKRAEINLELLEGKVTGRLEAARTPDASGFTAGVNAETGAFEANVVIIHGGMSLDGDLFVPQNVLDATGKSAFEGVRMFTGHRTMLENMSGGERDPGKFVGVLSNVTTDKKTGALMGRATVFEPTWVGKLEAMRKAGVLDRQAVSVSVGVESEYRKEDGVRVVKAFKTAPETNSLDFVYAGKFDAKVLAASRDTQKGKGTEDMEIAEAKAEIDKLIAANKELVARVEKAEKDKLVAEVGVKLKDALTASGLPKDAVDHLTARYSGKENLEGLDADIAVFKKLIPKKDETTQTATKKVDGMGEETLEGKKTAQGLTADQKRDELIASYKSNYRRMGFTEAQAEEKAKGAAARFA